MNDDDISLILEGLTGSVLEMDEEKAAGLSAEAVESGINPYLAVSKGLARGMEIMGERYEKGMAFVPELLLASDAMYSGMDVLRPYLTAGSDSSTSTPFRGVIGVMEGDTHDIGKNLVKIMFEADGFEMTDLGRDVPINHFMEKAVKTDADIICISSLMSTTMLRMSDFIDLLKKEGIRDRFKVMVGGACVSPAYAMQIGADGYAPDALAAVKMARTLLSGEYDG